MRTTAILVFWSILLGGRLLGDTEVLPAIPVPVDATLKNPWPTDWEDEFQSRGKTVLKAMCDREKASGLGGRTYFENEKRAYGFLMAHLVAGERDAAMKELQREDAQARAWHGHTKGIDYFACFTLKHQMRKYFLFGGMLAPEYRRRMFDGAKLWTAEDPLHRASPVFVKAGEGWGPDVRNSWVDVRNTENLYLMRTTSVYLMAEETGNEATHKKYKEALLRYAASLYRVGMGEWDSENYHGHSLGPLLNLYDFAKDAQVKAAAKACLDYLCAIGAVKYYRGAFNGPSNRDYNHPQPFGGSAPCMLWLYFGDSPIGNQHFESDEVHVLTSSYRPPVAVVNLARKNFDRPVEIISSKPAYSASTTGDWKSPPAYFETQYFGRTFQMGSLVGGTSSGKTAVNGFKITVWDEDKGALALQCVPGPDPRFVGSAKYEAAKVAGENRVAQNGNIALWITEPGDAPWVWSLPEDVAIEVERDVTFLRADRTWVAIHPLNSTAFAADEALSRQLAAPDGRKSPWRGHRVLSSRGRGGRYCGLAIEMGEAPQFKDYGQFKEASLKKAKTDASKIADGIAEFTASNGDRVKIQFDADVRRTQVWRNSTRHELAEHAKSVFGSIDPTKPLIEQGWLSGELSIEAGGAKFQGKVDPQGIASFSNEQ
jgi:hypothetical protein